MRIMRPWSVVASCVLMAWTAHSARADLTITAAYNGGMQTGMQFQNTTPQSGVCIDMPGLCPKGFFSILFPWPGNSSKNLGTASVGANSPYLGIFVGFFNAEHKIKVDNGRGSVNEVNFKTDAVGFYNSPAGGPISGRDSYSSPYGYGGTCKAASVKSTPNGVYAVWQSTGVNNSTSCSVTYRSTDGDKINVTVGDVSFRYSLTLDKPWNWAPGIYRGSYLYPYGVQSQGVSLRMSNGAMSSFLINFVLSVQHDMYIHFATSQGGVVDAELLPSGGWSNWQARTPPWLSADVPFDFGTLGAVKIQLQCQYVVGDTCGVADLKGGEALAVDTLFTDSKFMATTTARPAADVRLSTKSVLFVPYGPAGGTGITSARLTFKTQQGVTQQMQAGHQYGGRVTIVFDADVYN